MQSKSPKMGRKAKSAALKKIAEWTSILSRREPTSNEKQSKTENRTPLAIQSQSTINTVNAYKVCIDKFILIRMQISNVNSLPKIASKRSKSR